MSALTRQMIEEASKNNSNRHGYPDTVLVYPGFTEGLLAWLKREKWISFLPKRQQKQIRLKDRLLIRKPYKKPNLPK